jgi:hypothetical protein
MAPQTADTGQQARPASTAQEVQDTLAALLRKIEQLEAENGNMQQLINAMGDTGKGRAKIEAPTKYGGDKEGLAGFLTQMRAYLRYYPDKFPDEASKVMFASSRLEGKALRWFEPSLNDWLTNIVAAQDDFTAEVFGSYDKFERESRVCLAITMKSSTHRNDSHD